MCYIYRHRSLEVERCQSVEPWLSVCRALSGSVGALSGLCRGSVGALSVDNCRGTVGLCRPLSADPDSHYACTVSTSVGLSRLCRSVGLSVCRSLSASVGSLSESVGSMSSVCRVSVEYPRVSVECESSTVTVAVTEPFRFVISVVKSLVSWGFPLVYSTSTAHFLGQAKDLQE